MSTIPPEPSDPLRESDGGVTPRAHGQLVAAAMEAFDCSRPDAESLIASEGAVTIERAVRDRWQDAGEHYA